VAGSLAFVVDGRPVEVPDDGCSLLEALRDRLGIRSPKDGCSPQGQCGCCTVLVDGQPRVARVTPARRVAGRRVTSVDGLEDAGRWTDAFTAAGASQCGFCTPGIIVRLAGTSARGPLTEAAVDQALLAHLCRCTGWQTIREAAFAVASGQAADATGRRSADDAARRATLEGRAPQFVGTEVARGRGGFAYDAAPLDALVAVRSISGEWVVGRRSPSPPLRAGAGPEDDRPAAVADRASGRGVARTLRTTWVEPCLETGASWCVPGGEPATALANGGAFGGKATSEVGDVARRLADEHGRPVRVLLARRTPCAGQRPPLAAGVRADGAAWCVARTPGIAGAIAAAAPGLEVEEVDVAGPPTSRGEGGGVGGGGRAGGLVGHGAGHGASPDGAEATAAVDRDGRVAVSVQCRRALDAVVLRSFCIGAAHMALGWVRSEGIAVDDEGEPLDLTIRSFGILRAVDTPPIDVTIEEDDGEPVNGSDAVFAAVAAAAWRAVGFPERWPAR
jgi:aerobic-type carbon monoxide dehydrogenase small subunit (CoxS/CutS family)